MIVVHGLKNCDTCKKAVGALSAAKQAHRFHDVRADGLTEAMLDRWMKGVGWESLLNRRGTTWRGLPAADTEGVDEAKARALMLSHPALIKRPVFEKDGSIVVGFGPKEKAALGLP